jgi:outer membrane protein assembly factor BamB
MLRSHAPKLLLAVVFLSLSAFVVPARAQRDAPSSATTPAVGDPVTLPQDVQARQRLTAAEDYIKAQAWPEAIRLLQSLLDKRTDSFRRVTYRDARGRTSQRWSSIRPEADQLLAHLPRAGADVYLLTYNARARRELADARRSNDPAAILEVARRYRYTDAGIEALAWVGSYHLDRGHADLAATCFRQLLRHPGSDRLAPTTLFKAALAERLAPSADQRPEALRKLAQRLGDGGLRLGSETYSAEQLRQIIDRWPGSVDDNCLLYRGDPARSGVGRAEAFSLEAQWRLPTVQMEVAREWLLRRAPTSGQVVLPAAVPVAVGDRIVFRDAAGLSACDARFGTRLWRRPMPRSLAAVLTDTGQKVQVRNWFHKYGSEGMPLVENATLGTLSSDGRLVFAIDDLPLPPHPSLLQNENGLPQPLGSLQTVVGHNRLRALDAATGEVVWQIGGGTKPPARGRAPAPAADDPLTEACFLGVPLPLGGQLFVLVEKQQELRLACLDTERGGLHWTQLLATARDKMSVDVVRRTQAAHLAYADGILVCPTQSGAVLGVDPLSRSLVWAYVYARKAPRDEGPTETPSTPPRSRWKNAPPIINGGRIIFTPADSDEILCLRLHDGSLAWKAPRTEGDLFVGCVHHGRVLVVGRSSCRALALDTGETIWQRATGLPAGQGVASGSTYYLPLRGGGMLALSLERPAESVRLDARALRGELGNLVFHRGILWSQSATEVIALTPLRAQLARLEQRLARTPHAPDLLAERGRLRLEGGDVAGAAADLHDALAHQPSAALRSSIQSRLFAALTQLLQRDFTAGEKYLAEYRALCRPAIPPSTDPDLRPGLEREQRRRSTQYLALVALGREKQGRILDALEAYRELGRRPGELMAVPDDPAVQTRPDLWVEDRVASLLRRAGPQERPILSQYIRRAWQTTDGAADRASLRRFLTLFGANEGEEASLTGEARLRLASQLGRAFGRRHALEAELLLSRLGEGDNRAKKTPLQARVIFEHAQLMTRCGLLKEAVADYRRLAREWPATVVQGGQTGLELLDGLRTDKRFLAEVEPVSDPWRDTKLRASVLARGRAVSSLRLPCIPCCIMDRSDANAPNSNEASARERTRELPEWCRSLRFFLDGSRLQLQVCDGASGVEQYAIPLPLAGLPPSLRDGELYYQAIDHLLVLCVGAKLLGVDLLERCVRWTWNLLESPLSPSQPVMNLPDGGVLINVPNPPSTRRLGLIGPIGRSAVCVQTARGLTALDPASGEVCWVRTDAHQSLAVFGDDDYLFLVDQTSKGEVRAVRAIRARNGQTVSTPDVTPLFANRRRSLGRLLLVEEPATDERRTLRLCDPLTGNDLWRKTIRLGAFLLKSPDAGRLGIVDPSGEVTVVDLTRHEEVARLSLDRRDLAKVHDGFLLIDRERCFVALHGPLDPEWKIASEPVANPRGGLSAVPVNGMLYAFSRVRGEMLWSSWLPPQMLLLDQFEESPLVLCNAVTSRVNAMDPGNTIAVTSTRSIDKRTGKVLYNREAANSDLFHTLHLDGQKRTIDLISASQRLRHAPLTGKP